MVQNGFIWLRGGTQGAVISTYFHKVGRIWLPERLWVVSKGLCSMWSVLKSIRTAGLCLNSTNGIIGTMYSTFVSNTDKVASCWENNSCFALWCMYQSESHWWPLSPHGTRERTLWMCKWCINEMEYYFGPLPRMIVGLLHLRHRPAWSLEPFSLFLEV
jgi:hypothetical protein